MKKVIILLGLLFGASIFAHAGTTQSVPLPALGDTQGSTAVNGTENTAQPPTTDQSSPANAGAEKVGTGSGDDIDTVNEADPANDKDPEASDDTDTDSKNTPSNKSQSSS